MNQEFAEGVNKIKSKWYVNIKELLKYKIKCSDILNKKYF